MIYITLPDGSQREFPGPVTVAEVAASIGAGLAKAALAGKIGDKVVDTSYQITADSPLSIVTAKDADGLDVIRHSTAHLLAYAVKELFPDAQVTIGPVIENGFYYDFSYKRPFTPEDLVAIEKKMTELANKDEHLRSMLAGVIRRQFKCIELDPYANAFLDPYDPNPDHQWMSDQTQMRPELHERKWEIDSLCYPLRLAYEYWLVTGDDSVFDEHWMAAVRNILKTFREQQRKEGVGPYTFMRVTDRQLDTVCNMGKGNPVNPVGLIASVFRPSDDATTFLFLVPSNFFAVTSLRKAAEILTKVNGQAALAAECTELAAEVETALKKYATYNHPEYGTIYAFEVDGYGNRFLMDDANVPSLLAMPYLGDMDVNDPIYQNTRRFVWSEANPYFFRGSAGEGIGGPHVGYDMAWPMSIMMKAFTSQDDAEIKRCVEMLMTTDAGTGFMHESFNVNDPTDFTRSWFAWQNTLFGELILKLVNEGKVDLLNSITVK